MKMTRTLLPTCALFAAAAFGQGEDYSTWGAYRAITINTAAGSGGANVAGTVTNFPVLVRLTSAQADVFSGSLGANGADIRFTASNGTTRLKHERERWNAAGQTAEFWVLVPGIAGNATTNIRMFWGKSGAADSSRGSAVFDTANAYRGVWHMNAEGVGSEADATVNGFTMTPSPSAPATNASGAIGPARSFSGTEQYFAASNPSSVTGALNLSANTARTMSAWAYATTIGQAASDGLTLVGKGDLQYNLQIFGGANSKRWEIAVYTSTWRAVRSRAATQAAAGAWYHIVGTWSGGANSTNGVAQIFVNGVLDSTASNLAIGTPNPTTSFYTFIGANPNAAGGTAPGTIGTLPRYWAGHLDEISIAATVRSADWIKLSYETQKPGATAVTVLATGTPVFNPRTYWNNPHAIRSQGSSFVFRVPERAAGTRISVTDVRGREVWGRTVSGRVPEEVWDSRAPNGGKLPPGVYMARITVKEKGAEATVAQRALTLMP
jgi:biopolymer transport protein ExbB